MQISVVIVVIVLLLAIGILAASTYGAGTDIQNKSTTYKVSLISAIVALITIVITLLILWYLAYVFDVQNIELGKVKQS